MRLREQQAYNLTSTLTDVGQQHLFGILLFARGIFLLAACILESRM